MKNFWLVIIVKNQNDKYYSWLMSAKSYINIKELITSVEPSENEIISVNIAETKRDGENMVKGFNEQFKIEQRYMYEV